MIRIFALLAFLVIGPAQAQQSVFVPVTQVQIPITGTVAAATRIIANSGISGGPNKQSIYITAIELVPVPTAVVTLTAGTGTNCGTNTVSLTGALTFSAGQSLSHGTGYGTVLVAPPGDDVCITIGTAAAPGSIAYGQF